MNTLIRHIEYLITRHDCVIIPGFGAILATYVSAEYDAEANAYMPPYRRLAFNSTLQHNDGVLASSIQQAEGISYESALTKIRTAVDGLLTCLHEKGEVSLGAIGTIVSEDKGASQYLRDTNSDCIGIQSFWLPMITTSVIAEQEAKVIKAPIERRTYPRFMRIIKGAASIALLLGIGFVASTPLTVDNAITLASLAPEISHVTTADIVPPKQAPAVLTIIAPRDKAEDAPILAETAEEADTQMYYVVVATLTTKSEADRYIAGRSDQALKILEKGAHYKVYSSAHSDVYEAYRAAAKASKSYPDAWVYKK